MQQRSGGPVRVDVGLVGNVDTVTLQEADPGQQLELRDHVVELLLVERPIERHLEGVHAAAKLVDRRPRQAGSRHDRSRARARNSPVTEPGVVDGGCEIAAWLERQPGTHMIRRPPTPRYHPSRYTSTR